MKQAKTLSKAELNRVLAVVDASKHAQRNRITILLSFYAGMRVKEIAALKISDAYDLNQTVKQSILLCAAQTKGSKGRVIVLNKKLQRALTDYFINCKLSFKQIHLPLLPSQK